MTTWIIEPRDPLIVRDGRPFGLIPGARARSLGFPFPSTTAGALRTRSWQDAVGAFSPPPGHDVSELLETAVAGPLLVALDGDGEIETWYAPVPADALPTELDEPQGGRLRRVPLAPLNLPLDCLTDLPADLAPVGPPEIDPRKPYGGAPRFWRWSALEAWLLRPAPDGPEGVEAVDLGLRGLQEEWRTHVRIDHDRQAAEEGMLFQTNGLEFTTRQRERLALAVVSDETVAEGLGPVGGEDRLAA